MRADAAKASAVGNVLVIDVGETSVKMLRSSPHSRNPARVHETLRLVLVELAEQSGLRVLDKMAEFAGRTSCSTSIPWSGNTSGCRDVPFTPWFCPEKRPHPRPYASLIVEGYTDHYHCTQAYVDELFSEAKALALKDYLHANLRKLHSMLQGDGDHRAEQTDEQMVRILRQGSWLQDLSDPSFRVPDV